MYTPLSFTGGAAREARAAPLYCGKTPFAILYHGSCKNATTIPHNYRLFFIWFIAFFSSRDTWAWLMPTSADTCIWVLPS